jgi:hypothetical protein
MVIRNIETDPGPDDSVTTPTGPGNGPMSPGWIIAVALYLVFISALVLYGLIKLWPYPTPSGEVGSKTEGPADTSKAPTNNAAPGATSAQTGSTIPATQTPLPNAASRSAVGGTNAGVPSVGAAPQAVRGAAAPSTPAPVQTGPGAAVPGTATPATTAPVQAAAATPTPERKLPDPEKISFFGGRLNADIYLETRLLLLVMLAGALGSLMHSLRSLYWYTGNRMMVWSWVGFYLLLPLTGAILAVIFYFVVRGGFFSPQAKFENTSPFGFAALSALVGLFSPQATLKLKEIAETIFTKPGSGKDTKPQAAGGEAAAPGPTVNPLTPAAGGVNGGEKITIGGTGFATGVVVKFGAQPAIVTSSSSTAIEVVAPASVSGPAVVDVEVTNPDGQKAIIARGYTYQDGSVDSSASDDSVDAIDGCEVDIIAETPDEDLPPTEGGVA